MARCGCGTSSVCTCLVTAGAGVTVTGSGNVGSPYVISAATGAFTVVDTPTVDHTLSGTGTAGDPYVLSSQVKVDPAPGELITVTANGLRVDCATIQATCGLEPVTVLDTTSVDMTLAGQQISAVVIPDPAKAVVVGPNGVGVCLSTDAGNTLVYGTDGCLFVPTSAANTPLAVTDTNSVNLTINPAAPQTLSADVIRDPAATNILTIGPAGLLVDLNAGPCGLTGDGTAASPLTANVATWPFTCDQDTNAAPIYCSPTTGQLQGPPQDRQDRVTADIVDAPAGGAVLAPGQQRCITSLAFVDTTQFCDPVVLMFSQRVFTDLTMPAGTNYRVFAQRSIDGGPIVPTNSQLFTNSPGGSIQDRRELLTNEFVLAPGVFHSISFSTCVENREPAGGNNLTFTRADSNVNGIYVTQRP